MMLHPLGDHKMYKAVLSNPHKLILSFSIYCLLCVSVASANDHSEGIYGLEVDYVYFSLNEIYPAYFDHKNKTVYIWEDVKLKFEDIELSQDFLSGTMMIAKESEYIVKKAKPEIFLLEDGESTYFGYYAKGTVMFYRWRGLVLKDFELPENLPIKTISKKDLRLEIIDISIPKWFWDKIMLTNKDK